MGQDYIFFIYGVFFILTVLFSVLVNGLLLRFARTLGVRSHADTVVRWNPNVKPSLGGLTFFIIFLLSLSLHALVFPSSGAFIDISSLGEIAAIILAFLIGLADDAYDTRPFLKFTGQLTCAILLVITGNEITIFQADWANYLITVFWVVGLMNSINMLDNMDAITAVVSLGIVISCMVGMFFSGDVSGLHFLLMTGVAGALAGFLFYNWHPSKLFMGDTGSQFLGGLLGILGIDHIWNNKGSWTVEEPLTSVILAVLVFILPLTDTTTVTINRLLKRQSPFIGGRDHTTHNLSYLGLTDSQVAMTFAFIMAVSILLLWITLKYASRWGFPIYLTNAVFCVVVFAGLYSITRIKKKNKP